MSEKLKKVLAIRKAHRLINKWLNGGYQSAGWVEDSEKNGKVEVVLHLYPTFTHAVELNAWRLDSPEFREKLVRAIGGGCHIITEVGTTREVVDIINARFCERKK